MEKTQLIQTVIDAQAGKSDALNLLFNEYYNDVFYFALKTVKDENTAADITQETFIEIINTIGNLREPAAFASWMRRIAYHQCTAYFKKNNGREVLVDEDEDSDSVFDTIKEDTAEFIPDEALEKDDFKNTILSMIDELSEEQRSATLMYYFDELSVEEIANVQGVSTGTVKSRLNYSRKAIKKSVEDYEEKYNIKLHAIPFFPFVKWLFESTSKANISPEIIQGAAENISVATGVKITATAETAAEATAGTVAAESTVSTAGEISSEVAATVTEAVSSGTAAGVAAGPIVTKIVAGLVAVLVVGGGVAGYSMHKNGNSLFDIFKLTDGDIILNIQKEENQNEEESIQAIQEAMDAYFEVVIKGCIDLGDNVVITDDIRNIMLKAAPEYAWSNIFFLQEGEEGLDYILELYLYSNREIIRAYLNEKVGYDYTIDYEIINHRKLNKKQVKALDDKMSSISAIRGYNLNSKYIGPESEYFYLSPVIKKGSLEEAYKINVKYSASGSENELTKYGEYVAIKTDGNWYITKDNVFKILGDTTLTGGISGLWNP